MKAIIIYIIILLSIASNIDAQVNLVPNPSFEISSQCPYNPAQVSFAPPWVDPNNGSSDYYNSCNANLYGVPVNTLGNQSARTGDAYAGLYVYFNNLIAGREYIQAQLNSALLYHKNYAVEFYVSLADTISVAANVSLYFSDIAITETSAHIFNVTPQIVNDQVANPLTDKSGWTKISGIYNANGNENYLTLGSFIDDANTDTTHVSGGSYPGSYYYIDDIRVICMDCDTVTGINEANNPFRFILYPNPAQNIVNINYEIPGSKSAVLNIYDFTGKLISTQMLTAKESTFVLNTSNLANGVYLCTLVVENSISFQRLVILH